MEAYAIIGLVIGIVLIFWVAFSFMIPFYVRNMRLRLEDMEYRMKQQETIMRSIDKSLKEGIKVTWEQSQVS